jgi:hypothetical protein
MDIDEEYLMWVNEVVLAFKELTGEDEVFVTFNTKHKDVLSPLIKSCSFMLDDFNVLYLDEASDDVFNVSAQ